MEKPLITIPEKDTPVTGMLPEVKNRFDKIDTILTAVVVAVVIALISIVVAVFGIFLDQMRYNNAAYKEYADKEKINNVIFQEIKDLLKQNQGNIESQQKIIDSINRK